MRCCFFACTRIFLSCLLDRANPARARKNVVFLARTISSAAVGDALRCVELSRIFVYAGLREFGFVIGVDRISLVLHSDLGLSYNERAPHIAMIDHLIAKCMRGSLRHVSARGGPVL